MTANVYNKIINLNLYFFLNMFSDLLSIPYIYNVVVVAVVVLVVVVTPVCVHFSPLCLYIPGALD